MPAGMHALVTEAEVDASREKFSFSKKKPWTVVISSKKKKTEPSNSQDITLYNAKIKTPNTESYLGI